VEIAALENDGQENDGLEFGGLYDYVNKK